MDARLPMVRGVLGGREIEHWRETDVEKIRSATSTKSLVLHTLLAALQSLTSKSGVLISVEVFES